MPFTIWPKNKKGEEAYGLTVLELLITLAAIGIVVLVAVPGSTLLLEKYRLKSASDSIVTGLELARAEAGARSSTVIVCPSSNGHTCRHDGNWDHGWIVFTDGDGNGSVQDIELLRSFDAPNPEIHVIADGALQKKAAFTATGLVRSAEDSSGRFLICLKDSDAPPTLVNVDADGWVQRMRAPEQSCARG